MDIQEIFSVPVSRLPLAFRFKKRNTGSALLYTAGSAQATATNSVIGYDIKIDSQPGVHKVSELRCYANSLPSRTLVSQVDIFDCRHGDNLWAIVEKGTDKTAYDSNDFVCGTVMYMSRIMPEIWHFKGPLPWTKKFKSQINGQALVFISGSAWNKFRIEDPSGLSLLCDGKEVAKTTFASGVTGTHIAYPPQFMPINLKYGQHELTLKTTSDKIQTDGNDTFEVSVIY